MSNCIMPECPYCPACPYGVIIYPESVETYEDTLDSEFEEICTYQGDWYDHNFTFHICSFSRFLRYCFFLLCFWPCDWLAASFLWKPFFSSRRFFSLWSILFPAAGCWCLASFNGDILIADGGKLCFLIYLRFCFFPFFKFLLFGFCSKFSPMIKKAPGLFPVLLVFLVQFFHSEVFCYAELY